MSMFRLLSDRRREPAGLAEDAVTWTASSGAAADLIAAWVRAGDLILVKGSRGIRTDLVVERIIAESS